MTMIISPASDCAQAILLKAHCRLFKAGMKHSKMSAKELRGKVAGITGKSYRAHDWDVMIADLTLVIDKRR